VEHIHAYNATKKPEYGRLRPSSIAVGACSGQCISRSPREQVEESEPAGAHELFKDESEDDLRRAIHRNRVKAVRNVERGEQAPHFALVYYFERHSHTVLVECVRVQP